jgi:hypothetical protein
MEEFGGVGVVMLRKERQGGRFEWTMPGRSVKPDRTGGNPMSRRT